MSDSFTVGARVRINGDKRFEKDAPAVVLDTRAYSLVQVRLGNDMYATKATTVMVSASKLTLI